jgi:hypothetical protein
MTPDREAVLLAHVVLSHGLGRTVPAALLSPAAAAVLAELVAYPALAACGVGPLVRLRADAGAAVLALADAVDAVTVRQLARPWWRCLDDLRGPLPAPDPDAVPRVRAPRRARRAEWRIALDHATGSPP